MKLKEPEINYPIKFKPILFEKIWGGDKLKKVLNKDTSSEFTGESWEISAVNDEVSVIANGPLKGKLLTEIIYEQPIQFLGKKVADQFGTTFPLLFKFIDAKRDLSVQLHPNDELAKARHNSFGKTEMWYLIEAESNAQIHLGFNEYYQPEEYLGKIKTDRVLEMVRSHKAKKGQAYLVQAGTIHAIGKDVLLAEIQQTSDITYRIYDWKRKDLNGDFRELHLNLAFDALDFNQFKSDPIQFEENKNTTNEIVSDTYFTVNKVNITKRYTKTLNNIDSFIVYMCVDGSGTIQINNNLENIQKGETVLIPASTSQVEMQAISMELLEVYI